MFSFFGVGMKTDIFQSCGHWWVFQICWHIECITLIASSFRIWNSLAGIPSPPLVKECFSSVQFSCSVMSDSLRPHESQHARPPCPSPTPGVHSDSRPSSPWCHPAISCSVVPFSSCLQSFLTSGSFPMSQLFTSGGQSIGTSYQVFFLNLIYF